MWAHLPRFEKARVGAEQISAEDEDPLTHTARLRQARSNRHAAARRRPPLVSHTSSCRIAHLHGLKPKIICHDHFNREAGETWNDNFFLYLFPRIVLRSLLRSFFFFFLFFIFKRHTYTIIFVGPPLMSTSHTDGSGRADNHGSSHRPSRCLQGRSHQDAATAAQVAFYSLTAWRCIICSATTSVSAKKTKQLVSPVQAAVGVFNLISSSVQLEI